MDTFYITDLLGGKITSKQRLNGLQKRLTNAAERKTDKETA